MLDEHYTGKNLVLVVGSPRSGTTWVQRLLASHPDVETGQESDVFDLYVGPQLRTWRRELEADTSGRGGVGLGCYHLETEFVGILRRYLLELIGPMVGELEPGQLFLEKTPSHVLFIHEIRELLPDARFVHVLRDGRDVVASLLAASRSWGSGWAPDSVWRATRMWARHVEAGLAAAATLPGSTFHQLRYEDLLAEPAVELRQLATFLELEWREDALEEAVAGNSAETVRGGGGTPLVRGGEFARRHGAVVKEPTGFVRSASTDSSRNGLSAVRRAEVRILARGTLARAGYR